MPISEAQEIEWRGKLRQEAKQISGTSRWYLDKLGVINCHRMSTAFAVNVTLLHDSEWSVNGHGIYQPGPNTVALIGERNSKPVKRWSGISGYIDEPYHAHPIASTARKEIDQEVGISVKHHEIDFFLGQPFGLDHELENERGEQVQPTDDLPKPMLYLLPVIGICTGAEKPEPRPDGKEITAAKWVSLGQLATLSEFDTNPDYPGQTLPHALTSLIKTYEGMSAVLGVPPGPKWPELDS